LCFFTFSNVFSVMLLFKHEKSLQSHTVPPARVNLYINDAITELPETPFLEFSSANEHITILLITISLLKLVVMVRVPCLKQLTIHKTLIQPTNQIALYFLEGEAS